MTTTMRILALSASIAAFSACAPRQPLGVAPDPGSYDLVIGGGRVIDGTGSAWFHGDVGIRGDLIARIAPAGMLAGARATQRIDARGMVVAPGFIDIQSHSRGDFLTGDGRI